jgi:F-type H+-transporting ATPase subunit b
LVQEARAAADELRAVSKTEAEEQLEKTRAKAHAQAERIVSEAREQLNRDIEAARRQLRTETAKLVAEATETLLNEKLDQSRDAALIGRALED